jgi:heme-degrading monooxygenase HmoA
VIVEHALLPVRAGMSDEFRLAFSEAKAIISRMPGFKSLTLSRCIERPDVFLLLVEWDRLEDHTVGFRGSPDYQQWRELLHRFYEPLPLVEHFEHLEHV